MNSTARLPHRITPLPRPGRRLERRKQRSSSCAEALELALSAAADGGELDVVLVADDFGMLVASSKTELELDMLAAITPIVSRGRAGSVCGCDALTVLLRTGRPDRARNRGRSWRRTADC